MDLETYLRIKRMQKKEFAEMLGISPITFSTYVNGTRRTPTALIALIIKLTNGKVTLEDFVEMEKKGKKKNG